MTGSHPLISLLWMLVCVAAITGLAYWFTRYVVGKRMYPGIFRQEDHLQLLHVLPLGKNQRIAVVQAGKRYFLLGMTEQQITLLSELDGEEVSAWQQEDGSGEHPTFREALLENLQKKSRGEKK